MKRITALILTALIALSCVAMTGCGAKSEPLSFGMGIYSYYSKATSADGETNGEGEAVSTAAAVLLDSEGKIVDCVIDTADNTVSWTSAGEAITSEKGFMTKYELGTNYNMAAYGNDLNGDGVVKEWFEQVDAFCAAAKGKTLDEVKAMLVDGYYGNDELKNAGCTIGVADFVKAVEKAVANASASDATAADTLKLGVVTTQSVNVASEEANGSNDVDTTFAAAVVDKDGAVKAMVIDTVSVSYKFDIAGATSVDIASAINSKYELGTNYNMAAYGNDLNGDGVVKEWFEQADVFCAQCIGKNANEISAFVVDGYYGNDDLKTAGCTIGVADMVRAAVKAATIG